MSSNIPPIQIDALDALSRSGTPITPDDSIEERVSSAAGTVLPPLPSESASSSTFLSANSGYWIQPICSSGSHSAIGSELPIHQKKRKQDSPPITVQKACPPTPMKKSRIPLEHRMPFIRNAEAVGAKIFAGRPFSLEIGKEAVQVLRVEKFLGSGNYCEAYLVHTNLGPRVLKIPGERLKNMGDLGIASYLSNLLLVYKQFKQILENEVFAGRVAEFDDLNPFLDVDDKEITPQWAMKHLTNGCHLVEYIPESYPVDERTGSLDPKAEDYEKLNDADTQLAFMFRAALGAYPPLQDSQGRSLSVDLQKDNVRLDPGGILVLTDPAMPDDEDILTLLDKFLKTFAPVESERYRNLDPR